MRRKLHTILTVLGLLLLVLSCNRVSTVQAATAAYGTAANPVLKNGNRFTGIKTIDGVRYYKKNGVIGTKKGFVTYHSKRYYVKDSYGRIYTKPGYLKVGTKTYVVTDTRGIIATKQIRKDAKYGYYWVGSKGAIDKRKVIKLAIAFVLKNSNASDSNEKRLRDCYRALLRYPYSSMSTQIPTEAQLPEYATYMLTYHRGNCYRYAATMAYIAKVLGFKSRVGAGGVTARGPRAALSPHGWCEVLMSGTWKLIDCSMQRVNYNNNLCLVNWENYPYRIRKDKTLTVS